MIAGECTTGSRDRFHLVIPLGSGEAKQAETAVSVPHPT